jgi:hypothetical protein
MMVNVELVIKTNGKMSKAKRVGEGLAMPFGRICAKCDVYAQCTEVMMRARLLHFSMATYFSLFFASEGRSDGYGATDCAVPGFAMAIFGTEATVAIAADDYLEWIACEPVVVGRQAFAAVVARAKLPGVRTGHDLGSGWRAAYVNANGERTFLNAPHAGICERNCSFSLAEEQVSLWLNGRAVTTGDLMAVEPPQLTPLF